MGVALAFGLVPLTPALALTPADALAVVQGETDDRIDALNRLATAGDQRAADEPRAPPELPQQAGDVGVGHVRVLALQLPAPVLSEHEESAHRALGGQLRAAATTTTR